MQEFAYFQRQDSEQFSFYKIPKVLFTDQRFSSISTEAKIMYGVMLDRVSLSRKNGWIDENGNIYIQFTLAEMMEYFHWSKYKIYEILKELGTDGEGIGLVERKRTGCNKPNVLYVKNFASILNCKSEDLDFRQSEIRTSEQSDIRISDSQTSGFPIVEHSDFRQSDTSNTNNSNTDNNKTDISRISEKHCLYGTFHNVFLKDLELRELKRRFPYEWGEWIERLSSYMKSTGKKYHNHYATICSWASKEKKHATTKNYDVPEGKGL